MTPTQERLHIDVAGGTPRERGQARGRALRPSLAAVYAGYSELYRASGVSAEQERAAVGETIAAVRGWRSDVLDELEGVAEGAGVDLDTVVALNARTEILALGSRGAHECSTVTAVLDGSRYAVQTWDWHVEFEDFWHTQTVAGIGLRYAGLTEQGILGKIGVNEAGLALHFNILGHADDGVGGVPVHLLAHVVLSECATVAEALTVIRRTPLQSSTALTVLDASTAVSAELTPVGVFVVAEVDGSVQRTNHFQHEVPLAAQKSALYEPDSTQRLDMVRARLAQRSPRTTAELVDLLSSQPGEPPLTCVPDMSLALGDRWSTLATIVSHPETRTIRILDGTPLDAADGRWITLHA